MKNIRQLALKNLSRKPGRTAILLVLVTFLSLGVFGGSLILSGLRSGLKSLEGRLGADIIVVPASARSKVDLNNILLNGTSGYFYMDQSVLEKVKAVEGVETASPQLFLASLRADCCSVAVQVIGIDQETDFSIQPWIEQKYTKKLETLQAVVGCDVNAGVGDHIRIYNQNCMVAAKLARTGTGLDTAVYTNLDTIRLLLEAAEEMGHSLKVSDPDEVISAVYVKVKDGYDVEDVANQLNVYVRKTDAVQTKSMLTEVSDSLTGIAQMARILMAVLCLLVLAVLAAAFCLLMHERRREFAVLRTIGASGNMLVSMIRTEVLALALGGGVLGILLGALVIFPFTGLIGQMLGVPFLLPDLAGLAAIAGITLAASLLACLAASAYMVRRLSRIDPGDVLREGN